MSGWHALTWLGDSALLLPAAAFIALWLAVSRRTRAMAWGWLLAFGLCGGLVMVSKVAFMGWGLGIRVLDFTGFSGHTAVAALVWPVALWLLASRAGHGARMAAAGAGWLLALAVGVSRLAIDAHSPAEVAAGYALGAMSSAVFLLWQQSRPHPQWRALWVGLSLLLPAAVLTPGQPAPTHQWLMVGSAWLAAHACPYTRADLHQGTRPAPRLGRRADLTDCAASSPAPAGAGSFEILAPPVVLLTTSPFLRQAPP